MAEHLRVPLASLTPATRLLQDLGLDGHASGYFMQHFSERFRVDLSGFRQSYHFHSGPVQGSFWKAFSFLFERDRSRDIHDVPITLQDLVEAAHAGTWTFPNTNKLH